MRTRKRVVIEVKHPKMKNETSHKCSCPPVDRSSVWNKEKSFFSLRYFFTGKSGGFSKRAFFFTLFACLSAVYVVGCLSPFVKFNGGLGTFILGCNAAFGLNYYQNEKDKTKNVQ